MCEILTLKMCIDTRNFSTDMKYTLLGIKYYN